MRPRNLAGAAWAYLTPSGRAKSAERLVGPAIRIMAEQSRPGGAARLARLSMRTIYTPDRASTEAARAGRGLRRVVVLSKAGFTDDALSALKTIGGVEVITLSRRVLKILAAVFLPREVNDNNYASASPSAKAAMARYRGFLTRFWRALDRRRRIDAVMSGNFGYCAEREFAAALEASGVPFIVLNKENTKGSGGLAFWERVYRERRGPFLGRRILVYNPVEHDLMIRAGVVTPDRIEVVGMPRLDNAHRWRQAHVGFRPASTVLIASFRLRTRRPVAKFGDQTGERHREMPDRDVYDLSFPNLCRSVHAAAVELATACPELTVLIKTKGSEEDRRSVPELLGVKDERSLPPNMRVIHGGSPLPLICQAAVVCGFNTTLLLEALAAGRPVVVPWYAEALEADIGSYGFDPGDAVLRATSQADLVQQLRTLALERHPVPRELDGATKKLLHHWLGNDDGAAGARAAAAIRRVLEPRAGTHSRLIRD